MWFCSEFAVTAAQGRPVQCPSIIVGGLLTLWLEDISLASSVLLWWIIEVLVGGGMHVGDVLNACYHNVESLRSWWKVECWLVMS